MKTTILATTLSLVVILSGPTRLCGQCTTPDPTIWNVVNNTTGGLRAIPMVNYDPVTGMLSVDTLGMDRVSNTVGNGTIGGDDVGLISLLVQGPQGTVLPYFDYGLSIPHYVVLWTFVYFNSRTQIIGSTLLPDHQFLPPGSGSAIRYATDLSAADFGTVEIAVNFTANAPGDVLHGRVCIVPEPANAVLFWVAGAFAFFAANHRTSHPLKRP